MNHHILDQWQAPIEVFKCLHLQIHACNRHYMTHKLTLNVDMIWQRYNNNINPNSKVEIIVWCICKGIRHSILSYEPVYQKNLSFTTKVHQSQLINSYKSLIIMYNLCQEITYYYITDYYFIFFQITFKLTSEWEWRSFFGLIGTFENFCRRILKHGKNIMYSVPRIKGDAASHPNTCKSLINKWY